MQNRKAIFHQLKNRLKKEEKAGLTGETQRVAGCAELERRGAPSRGAPRPALGADTSSAPQGAAPRRRHTPAPSDLREGTTVCPCSTPRWVDSSRSCAFTKITGPTVRAFRPRRVPGALRSPFIFTTALCTEHACYPCVPKGLAQWS